MKDYLKTLSQFESRFTSEESRRDYLYQFRRPNGFVYPRCGSDKVWLVGLALFQCACCNYRLSTIAGTMFHDTHRPLTDWFRAI